MNMIRNTCAAALACASFAAAAQSGGDNADTHWKFSIQGGTVQDNRKTEPSLQLGMAYEFDRTWGVEALANLNALFERDGAIDNGVYEFDHAWAVRGLATLPLSERWSLVGGLGISQVNETPGLALHAGSRNRTGAMVSLAPTYRIGRRWSMGLEVSSFTQAHTFDVGLRGEFHF
jgi:hypothetical protein